ncbi:carbohydrate-binding WSC domain protein [Apodospora peruviana]|uniref:Carbohydrate-binding WSC domain protein n=1 Tax=Apodospora peruviana TaxID=516989 RepID=A0AAE0M4X8_9PEZI|nr:carbohydrate-binding WSC domain protein [Apodospora peruviana]
MQFKSLSGLLAAAAVTSACTLPTSTISNTFAGPIRVQVQNASYPAVNNLYMNLLAAGGGDQHLFVGPVGTPTYDLDLTAGSIGHGVIHAVIGGEDSTIDDTTKMFMTERGDPRALFQPVWACNPETDAVQINLNFVGKQNAPPGGWICVRPTFDGAHEFRYYPPNNSKFDPNRFCIKVQLVLVPQGTTTVSTVSTTSTTSTTSSSSSSTSTTLTTSTTSSSSSSTTSTTSTSSSSSSSTTSSSSSSSSTSSTSTTSSTSSSSSSSTSSTGTPTPLPYTDMTANGFRFIGCAPEERRATDGPGRVLPSALYAEDTMTNEKCMAFCATHGYAYAGTEYRRECWCGNGPIAPGRVPGTTLASLAGCNFSCMGNTAQICGGDSWLSLYQKCPTGGPCVNNVFT